MNVSKRLIQFANKYLLFAGREVRIGKNCARADSSPVVFIHEIQRRESWEPRKGAQGEIILCSSTSRAALCYVKTTGDESGARGLEYGSKRYAYDRLELKGFN